MSHYGIPWPVVRAAYRTARRLFFSRSPPEQDHLVTSASLDDLRAALGRRHFTNAWELSFHYEGEDLNMRRPVYFGNDVERPWYQTHVRGFEHGNGEVTLYAHFEYEPTAYPEAHLHGENLHVGEGTSRLSQALDDAGIQYESKVVS